MYRDALRARDALRPLCADRPALQGNDQLAAEKQQRLKRDGHPQGSPPRPGQRDLQQEAGDRDATGARGSEAEEGGREGRGPDDLDLVGCEGRSGPSEPVRYRDDGQDDGECFRDLSSQGGRQSDSSAGQPTSVGGMKRVAPKAEVPYRSYRYHVVCSVESAPRTYARPYAEQEDGQSQCEERKEDGEGTRSDVGVVAGGGPITAVATLAALHAGTICLCWRVGRRRDLESLMVMRFGCGCVSRPRPSPQFLRRQRPQPGSDPAALGISLVGWLHWLLQPTEKSPVAKTGEMTPVSRLCRR